jgi:trehalose 6-phosphate synthase
MSRIVCVSNRVSLPDPKTGEITAGGLAVGVKAALEGVGGGLWFGWNGDLVKNAQQRDKQGHKSTSHGNIDFITIPLTEQEFDDYYKGMANEGLWPFMHELADQIDEDGTSYKGYKNVNNLFAKQLKSYIKPDDVIWVHDYHLIPLGRALRRIGVENPLLFFNHIPVPGKDFIERSDVPEALRARYETLVQDLFAYDQVGLQSSRDLKKFLSYIGHETRSLPAHFNTASFNLKGRQTNIGAFPISIETDDINKIARSMLTNERVMRLKAQTQGRKLAIGADRLDYTKGLLERINGISHFLNTYPQNNEKIEFLQITPLSRDDISQYQRIISKVRQSVMSVNGRHGDEFYNPINFTEKNVPREVLMGYYRVADIGLVTSLMDGQHLGAKEFLAAQDPSDPGVLVLSQHAGAAEELGAAGALIIDPRKPEDIASKLETAFNMPKDQRVKTHEKLINHLSSHDVNHWARSFLKPYI